MDEKLWFYYLNGGLKRVRLEEVLYMKAADNYVSIITEKGTHTVRITFETLMEDLTDTRFLRVHRSFAIALHQIDEIGRDYASLYNVDGVVPVSPSYMPVLLSKIQILGSKPDFPEKRIRLR